MGKKARLFRRILLILLFLIVLLLLAGTAAGLIAWHWYLPDWLATRLVPQLGRSFGQEKVELKIRRIGLTGADLEGFRLTDAEGGILSVDSIRADYAPRLPRDGKEMLRVENLTLSGAEIGVRWSNGKFALSGVSLDRLQQALAQSAEKPEAATVPPEEKSAGQVIIRRITLREMRLRLDYEGRVLLIPIEAVITPQDPAWNKIEAQLTLSPRGQNLYLQLDFDRTTGKLTAKTRTKLRLEALTGLTGIHPEGTLKFDLDLSAGISSDQIELAGFSHFMLDLTKDTTLPLRFERSITGEQRFSLRWNKQDNLVSAVASGSLPFPAFTASGVNVAAEAPIEWKLSLAGSADAIRIADAELTTGKIIAEAYGCTLKAPLLRLYRAGGLFLLSGSGITIDNAAQKLAMREIAFTLPLPPTETNPGTLTAGSIQLDRSKIGSVSSTIQLRGRDFLLAGTCRSPLAPKAQLNFRGTFEPKSGATPEMLFEFNLPTYTPDKPLRLGDYVPSLGDAAANASLSLGGAVRLENGKLTTGLQVMLRNGFFRMPDSDLELSGLSLDLRFDDLFKLTTPPAQRLKIAKIRAGKINITDLEVHFEIESTSQVTIENAGFHWCGGELYMRPLRLRTNQQVWNTTFYCENINLATMLLELGIAPARTVGDGTVFGKLPVRFDRKRGFFFDRSYLYSRPGTESHIAVSEPDKLLAGGGAVLKQTQLEFASEALRDFNYNWVKFHLQTEADQLVISLQFDGQPVGPLPFGYDEESGELRRDPTVKAHFQGIQLNINTRVPLNLLLNLNKRLQSII